MFKTSDEKTSILPISLEIKNNISNNYFGPAFYMKMDSNLCCFNQAIQIIFHCPIIYKWISKETIKRIKSAVLVNLFLIGKDYYSNKEKPYVVKLNPAYNTLVDMLLAFSNLKYGEMGDVTDVFEIGFKRVHFINDNEHASIIRTTVLNLPNEVSINDLMIQNTEILLPDIVKKKNFKQWIGYNLKPFDWFTLYTER